MEKSGQAMIQIHRKLNVDTVDQIAEDLGEQHALGEQNAIAITNSSPGETVDETELDDELAEMERQRLSSSDGKMRKTGMFVDTDPTQ
ncbi:hypothetical protein VE02_08848 [Pseudogymnoascus sp. 03VT05]|nr:hypothetical protein VE02_08848 [Pseudogymnoascus sp. 03VT05]